jgi:hypothetical protein
MSTAGLELRIARLDTERRVLWFKGSRIDLTTAELAAPRRVEAAARAPRGHRPGTDAADKRGGRMKNIAMAATTLILALAACESSPTEIRFKLYGQGACFAGVYAIDDGDEIAFTGAESTTDVYLYSETVDIEDSVVIDVFPESTDDTDDDGDETEMTSLTCKVFDSEGELLYDETYSITSTHMKTFTFNLDDGTGETSTDEDTD